MTMFVLIVITLAAGYVIGSFFSPVISTEGTLFQHVSAWCKNSLTILWARALMAVGVAAGVALPVLEAVGTLNLTALLPPQLTAYAPLFIAGIGLVTELARRRSLDKEQTP